jgi:hypothetical protein
VPPPIEVHAHRYGHLSSACAYPAARSEDWDGLVTLEADCAAHVKALQRDEPQAALSAGQNAQKAALIA